MRATGMVMSMGLMACGGGGTYADDSPGDDTAGSDGVGDSDGASDSGAAAAPSLAYAAEFPTRFRAGDIVAFDVTGASGKDFTTGATLAGQPIPLASNNDGRLFLRVPNLAAGDHLLQLRSADGAIEIAFTLTLDAPAVIDDPAATFGTTTQRLRALLEDVAGVEGFDVNGIVEQLDGAVGEFANLMAPFWGVGGV